MIREYTQDRTNWDVIGEHPTYWNNPGLWHSEPDKVQWIDENTDLDCLAVRNKLGAWCGYVGLPPGHKYYNNYFDDTLVSVHGGLTYSGFCQEDAPVDKGVCHIPFPGRPSKVFWLGFDCAHCDDFMPRSPNFGISHDNDIYRTLDYVKQECKNLAAQLMR